MDPIQPGQSRLFVLLAAPAGSLDWEARTDYDVGEKARREVQERNERNDGTTWAFVSYTSDQDRNTIVATCRGKAPNKTGEVEM